MPKTFTDIPLTRPKTPLLDSIAAPADLRLLEPKELLLVADELRAFLLYSVGQTGGHFGAGLGVTELTVALHYVFNTPDDRIIWDVGHQTYPHKILTGRRERMLTMRQKDGLSGFPSAQKANMTHLAWATRARPSAPHWAWPWGQLNWAASERPLP